MREPLPCSLKEMNGRTKHVSAVYSHQISYFPETPDSKGVSGIFMSGIQGRNILYLPDKQPL